MSYVQGLLFGVCPVPVRVGHNCNGQSVIFFGFGRRTLVFTLYVHLVTTPPIARDGAQRRQRLTHGFVGDVSHACVVNTMYGRVGVTFFHRTQSSFSIFARGRQLTIVGCNDSIAQSGSIFRQGHAI